MITREELGGGSFLAGLVIYVISFGYPRQSWAWLWLSLIFVGAWLLAEPSHSQNSGEK